MNLEKAKKLKHYAKQTVKIIELLEEGNDINDVLASLRNFNPYQIFNDKGLPPMLSRPLVDYYKKLLK